MYEVILVLSGLLLGLLIFGVAIRKSAVGTLRIDQSDPEDGPYPFLEGTKPLHYIMSRKFIILKVKVENYISQ